MSLESHTTINIAKRERPHVYVHFCRVIVPGPRGDAKHVFDEFLGKFPAPYWQITATHWDCRGTQLISEEAWAY